MGQGGFRSIKGLRMEVEDSKLLVVGWFYGSTVYFVNVLQIKWDVVGYY